MGRYVENKYFFLIGAICKFDLKIHFSKKISKIHTKRHQRVYMTSSFCLKKGKLYKQCVDHLGPLVKEIPDVHSVGYAVYHYVCNNQMIIILEERWQLKCQQLLFKVLIFIR